MKAWKVSLMLVLGLILPARALDEDKGKEPGDAAKTAEKIEKECPIPRLAELRLDEYVVAARLINLPLPGKTKTVQDILDQLEEWSKDEKIGAVLMDVGYLSLSLPDVEALRAGVERLKKADR